MKRRRLLPPAGVPELWDPSVLEARAFHQALMRRVYPEWAADGEDGEDDWVPILHPVPKVIRGERKAAEAQRRRLNHGTYGREWPRERNAVLRRDYHHCLLCMSPATTAHHIKSRAAGGSNQPENLLSVCWECHAQMDTGRIAKAYLYRLLAAKYGYEYPTHLLEGM